MTRETAYYYEKRQIKLDPLDFSKNWGWFFAWGVMLIVLGVLSIGFSALTTLTSVVLLGVTIFLSGLIVIIDTMSMWWGKWSIFFPHLIIGILYTITGMMLIANPAAGSVSLTLLLAFFYMSLGILRVFYSLSLQLPKWRWSFFNGAMTFLIGALILNKWPDSSLYIIGLFIGTELLFTGWNYIILALWSRDYTEEQITI